MKPSRLRYKIGIGAIFILMAYAFWTQTTPSNRILIFGLYLTIVSFVFFAYWRLYQFYQLEKIQKLHDRIDFIDYIDQLDFLAGMQHFVLPLPIWKALPSRQENSIRRKVNFSTFMIYFLFALLILTTGELKK